VHGPGTLAHPVGMITAMEAATTISFLSAARLLTRAARSRRLDVPSFRSPPRLRGADRSLRRSGNSAIVAVRVRDRPIAAVVADMVEGIVAANRLTGVDADHARAALWAAVGTVAGGSANRAA
jgi:hypothetical protein